MQLTSFQKCFKIAQQRFEAFDEKLRTVFKYFSKKNSSDPTLTEDITLTVPEVINLLTKCKLIDPSLDITQDDAMFIIETFHAKGTRLADKLADEQFATYYRENPMSIQLNRDNDARKKRNAAVRKRKEEYDAEMKTLMATDPDAA